MRYRKQHNSDGEPSGRSTRKYLATPIHFENINRTEDSEGAIEALKESLYNRTVHKDDTEPDSQMYVFNNHWKLGTNGRFPKDMTKTYFIANILQTTQSEH